MKTDDIQPLSEVRPRLTQHIQRVRETGRPLFVTSNGRTAAVLMSPEQYDQMSSAVQEAQVAESIRRGMEDVAQGRVTDAREAMRAIAEQHGMRADA